MVSAVIGLKQGLVRSVFSLAGFVLGLVLAVRYFREVGALLTFIPHEGLAKVVAFLIVLAVVSIIAAFLSWITRSVVRAIKLGLIDHLAGAAFGFLLGAYFLGGILSLALRISFLGLQKTITDSALAGWILNLPLVSSFTAGTPLLPAY